MKRKSEDQEAKLPNFDRTAIDQEISDGAKALKHLQQHASQDWHSWSIVIRGLRALRTLALHESGADNVASGEYRKAFTRIVSLKKYEMYDRDPIDKQARTACYKLMNRIEDVDLWYNGQPVASRLRWKHPETIAKHCPPEFLEGGMLDKKKPAAKAKKKAKGLNAEAKRLLDLLLRTLAVLKNYDREAADAIYAELPTPEDPSDELDDVFPAAEIEEPAPLEL